MKKQKILAALLALSCAASMAVPAFAADTITLDTAATLADMNADDIGTGYEIAVKSVVQKPALKVTLPTTATVAINPYRAAITVDGVEKYDTVLSPKMDVVNNSPCAVKVNVKGSVVTYTVDGTDVSTLTEWTDAANLTGTDILTNKEGSTETLAVFGTSDNKTFYDQDGRLLTAKYTAGKAATATAAAVPAKLQVTGYTASKTIKVATAALKDEDAEKSNSIFLYAEGKLDADDWAAAFDAKNVAGYSGSGANQTFSAGGMVAIGTKETSGAVLYLGNGQTGNVRITGNAATAPTTPWMSVADTFDTKIVFVVDPVANAKPVAPEMTGLTATLTPNGAGTPSTFTATATTNATNEFDLTVNGAAKFDTIKLVPATTPASATAAYTFTDTAKLTLTSDTLTLGSSAASGDALTGDVTVTLTNMGMTSTYTIHLTVNVA